MTSPQGARDIATAKTAEQWKAAFRDADGLRRTAEQAATVASEDAMRIRLEVQVARDEVRDLTAAGASRIPAPLLDRLRAIGDRLARALEGRGPRRGEAPRWVIVEALLQEERQAEGRSMYQWALRLRSVADGSEGEAHAYSRSTSKFAVGRVVEGKLEERGGYWQTLVGARVVEAPGA